MKILLIGFLAFSTWSSFATYIYVCKIKGLCDNATTMPLAVSNNNQAISGDIEHASLSQKSATMPKTETVFFAFDKFDFNADAKTDIFFLESKAYMDQNSDARLSIIGHTDAIGSDEYNEALGYQRAQTMKQYMESKGLPSSKIFIESRGENKPIDNNNTTEGRSNNRRAVLTIKK